MKVPEKIQKDIDYIIDQCTDAGSLIDELSLLRISLRAYIDGADAEEAVAWASRKLSDTITNGNSGPTKK